MARMLDILCPMHVMLDRTGHIIGAGPTLIKVIGEELIGKRFLEAFELRRPKSAQTVTDLVAEEGTKLHLRTRDEHQIGFKGVLVRCPQTDNIVVNLSFGISIIDAVRQHKLTSTDFAATDLAIEMLFLVEAKSAAMDASRKLNQRLQGAKIAAEEQAFTDTLTGLKNRRALDHVLERVATFGGAFALMHLDLDYFKTINDTMGHAAGDHVLLEVARILVEETREDDTVARVGGDEFVLLFHNILDSGKLAEIASRLIERLEEPMAFGDQTCRISASIGIVTSPQGGSPDMVQLFEDADVALYASKHAGRGCYTFYSHELRNEGVLQGVGK